MAPAHYLISEVFEAEGRMGRRPLDRRSFRDACAAARLRKWPPENVSEVASLCELIVGRLTSSHVDYFEMVLVAHLNHINHRLPDTYQILSSIPHPAIAGTADQQLQ